MGQKSDYGSAKEKRVGSGKQVSSLPRGRRGS